MGFISLDDLPETFARHCSVRYDDNTIQIIGGRVGNEAFSSRTFYLTPKNRSAYGLSDGPSLNFGRQLHSCSNLGNSYIIVAGGRNYWSTLDSVEILKSISSKIICITYQTLFNFFYFIHVNAEG